MHGDLIQKTVFLEIHYKVSKSLQYRLESRNRLKDDNWRGAESGKNEFIA